MQKTLMSENNNKIMILVTYEKKEEEKLLNLVVRQKIWEVHKPQRQNHQTLWLKYINLINKHKIN